MHRNVWASEARHLHRACSYIMHRTAQGIYLATRKKKTPVGAGVEGGDYVPGLRATAVGVYVRVHQDGDSIRIADTSGLENTECSTESLELGNGQVGDVFVVHCRLQW